METTDERPLSTKPHHTRTISCADCGKAATYTKREGVSGRPPMRCPECRQKRPGFKPQPGSWAFIR